MLKWLVSFVSLVIGMKTDLKFESIEIEAVNGLQIPFSSWFGANKLTLSFLWFIFVSFFHL